MEVDFENKEEVFNSLDLNNYEENNEENNEENEYIEVKRPVTLTKSIIDELNIMVFNTKKNDKNECSMIDECGFQYVNSSHKKRNEGFYILANKLNISKHLKKTKFCNIYIQEGICNRKVCNFAHSIEEYNFPQCAFENNCKVSGCRFKHPYEDIEKYKKRVDFKLPKNIK